MLGITEVIENLYISGLETRQAILNKGIRCVLNISSECPVQDLGPTVEYEKISLLDLPSTSIQPYFDRLTDRIHRNLQQGKKTLVHCYVGRSRSATIILAYLMKYKQMPLREAFHYLRSRRHIVGPNFGFIKQLINYERSLFGYASVSFVNTSFGAVPDIYLTMPSTRSRRQPLTPSASVANPSSSLSSTPNTTLAKRISSSQPQRSSTTMMMTGNSSPNRSAFVYSAAPTRPVNPSVSRPAASALPTRATTTFSSYSPSSNPPATNSKSHRPASSSFTYHSPTMNGNSSSNSAAPSNSNGSPSKSILRQSSDVTRANPSTMTATTLPRSGEYHLPSKGNSFRTVKYVPSSYNRYHLT